MAITVSQLVAHPDLGLQVVGGRQGLHRTIAWAHTSELIDPSPWLGGGELLMTLGLNLPADPDGLRAYVERLASAGAAGLAVDTGLHPSVPRVLAETGDATGLPVLAVPALTPFLAISRAVINAITADQVQEVQRISIHQEQLASGALLSGTTGIVAALSAALSASVLLLDGNGRPLDAAGPATARLQWRVGARLGTRDRRGDGRIRRASFTHVDSEGVIAVQRLGSPEQTVGFLALGSPNGFSANERLVVRHAATLLAIVLGKPSHLRDAEARLRRVVFRLLLQQGRDTDVGMLRFFGFTTDDRVAVVVLTDAGPSRAVEAAIDERFLEHQVRHLSIAVRQGVALLVPADDVVELTGQLQADLGRRFGRPFSASLGNTVPLLDALESFRQACAAARVAITHPGEQVTFADLGVFDLLLGTQTRDTLEAIVSAVLRPIETEGGAELLDTTAEFLRHNGHWESAAAALGVHRHTLRNRIARVGRLLGRDMNMAHSRAEVWMALRARELLSIRAMSMTTLLEDVLADSTGDGGVTPSPVESAPVDLTVEGEGSVTELTHPGLPADRIPAGGGEPSSTPRAAP